MAAVLVSAAFAACVGAHPVGSALADAAWTAALAGCAAHLATRAKRGPLIAAALLACLAAHGAISLAIAAAAVAFAALSTRHLRRRAVFARGMAGGGVAASLLATSAHRPDPSVLLPVALAVALIVGSGLRHQRKGFRGADTWLVGGVLAAGALATLVALGSVGAAKGGVDGGIAELRAGMAAARAGDAAAARGHLDRAARQFERADGSIRRWSTFARGVPVAAQQVDAITDVLADGRAVAAQAATTAGRADDASLAVDGARLDLEALAGLGPPTRRLVVRLEALVDRLDGDHGPLVPALRERLEDLRGEASRALGEARTVSDAADVVPTILGADGPRRYLVLFTSPAEARGRLGFPGSYAEITFVDGQLQVGEHGTSSADLFDIPGDVSPSDLADPQVRPYAQYGVGRQFLSTTITPSFPSAARLAAELWARSGRAPVDGVLRFDPFALAALLDYTGPISLPGRASALTSATLAEYLVRGQYVEVPDDVAQRRERLGLLTDLTVERLRTVDLPPPGVLVERFAPLVQRGHLTFAAFDPEVERFLAAVRIDGELPIPRGDGLLVTALNRTGNKIDAFLERAVTYRSRVRSGETTADLSVALSNAAPPRGLPDYIIGSSGPRVPPGTNRTSVLAYTAVRPVAVEIDGDPVQLVATRTGGWWLTVVDLDIAPGGRRTVDLHLDGPTPGHRPGVLLLPGGGAQPDRYDVVATSGAGEATYRGRLASPLSVRP